MTDYNRNGHLSRFEDFAPVNLTVDEIVQKSIALKQGNADAFAEPEPTVVASFATADLVRYRLNSKRLYDAYLAMGDKHSDPHDEHGYADRCARFGVIDRVSGEPVAMLWIIKGQRDSGVFKIALPSFSNTRSLDQAEFLEVLRELDIPPSRRNGEDCDFARRYDVWYEDGEWIAKEPRHFAVVQFESICFSTYPPIKDRISVYVPIDPAMPLDGGGDENAAYDAKLHYNRLAQNKFWPMAYPVQPGHSSWMGFGDPVMVKATGRKLYEEWGADITSSPEPSQVPQP